MLYVPCKIEENRQNCAQQMEVIPMASSNESDLQRTVT